MSSTRKPKPLEKIADKFEVHSKLGSGCFGDVYKGTNIETKEHVAIKFESKSVEMPQLKHEANILRELNPDNSLNAIGFCFCYHSAI
jgi:serine/threonine protein kinase